MEHQGNVVHIRVPKGDPAKSLVEITTREQAFAPRQSGLGYIRIKGITFQHAGNAFPPPQRGLVSTGGGHHWVIEGNTIEWANGVGLDIGAQHWTGPRESQAGQANVVRGNTIRYVGVEGLGGMGTVDTLIEDNLIEWVGWQDAERAWEAAGAKFHRARNLLFRRNVIRHIRHANALWLDSDNVNSRITANVFADVLTVSAAIHMEMDRAANQIDNNIIWDVRNAEPGTGGQRGAGGSGYFPARVRTSDRGAESHWTLRQRRRVSGSCGPSAPTRAPAATTSSATTSSRDVRRAASCSWTRETRPTAMSTAGLPEKFGGLAQARVAAMARPRRVACARVGRQRRARATRIEFRP